MNHPVLIITILLIFGVIFVNGWTDAPNAIATCVATRSMGLKAAIAMAAVFNFLGVFVMTYINSTVAITIQNMVNFNGNQEEALISLCAALISIILWAVVAWYFGIPTSESHALIAGLSGAAIALHNGLDGINKSEWVKVLYGLLMSTGIGFLCGFVITKLVVFLFRNVDRRKTQEPFRYAQIFSAAAMAFMHGAQDGQKFLGVLMLGIMLSTNNSQLGEFPVWMMLLCSIVMALGTSLGGTKIIKSVGLNMVKMERYQGFCADLAGAVSLLCASVIGVPVSTTHTKTTAIMGVGATKRISSVNFSVVRDMILTWILTFPGCGLIGFMITKLFLVMQ